MHKEEIKKAVIEGYRNAIYQRYQFKHIAQSYELPASIDEETVTQLRTYFLTHMYPPYEKRAALNEAFESLEDYIKHPQKLVRIALDAAKLFFKYGRHLPKILSAGLNAMNTFKAATTFEDRLVVAALERKANPPFDQDTIDNLIKSLSREDIESFITSSQSLFEILHDRSLIKKIKEVIQYLILAMKKNHKAYAPSQIEGLEIGFKMIVEGDKLFRQLIVKDQRRLIDTITQIERDHLDRIF